MIVKVGQVDIADLILNLMRNNFDDDNDNDDDG